MGAATLLVNGSVDVGGFEVACGEARLTVGRMLALFGVVAPTSTLGGVGAAAPDTES
jgi:hypothetical protein